MALGPRSTPAGEHRPVMLDEVLAALAPQPGEIAIDCTLGRAGHAVELLRRIGPDGWLFAFDLDLANIDPARERLTVVGDNFDIRHGNFAEIADALAAEHLRADVILADLGMSSMQVDEADRGFSFARDGPLDMRMDPTRGWTAAEALATLPAKDLAAAFRELGDEPLADDIANAIVQRRRLRPLERTRDLADLIRQAAPVRIEHGPGQPTPRQQQIRPIARVFQALRILINDELKSLDRLLCDLPSCLNPGGRAAIISFHSGEDRLVKRAFRSGLREGIYAAVASDAIRAGQQERFDNPRSRSAKLRWARRSN